MTCDADRYITLVPYLVSWSVGHLKVDALGIDPEVALAVVGGARACRSLFEVPRQRQGFQKALNNPRVVTSVLSANAGPAIPGYSQFFYGLAQGPVFTHTRPPP